MKAPAVATTNPTGLTGVMRAPSQKNISSPQPIKLPPMPISMVPMAPPGSRPGMTALAASPTNVPNPTQTSKSLRLCSISVTSSPSMIALDAACDGLVLRRR